jgi:hypothetical protein
MGRYLSGLGQGVTVGQVLTSAQLDAWWKAYGGGSATGSVSGSLKPYVPIGSTGNLYMTGWIVRVLRTAADLWQVTEVVPRPPMPAPTIAPPPPIQPPAPPDWWEVYVIHAPGALLTRSEVLALLQRMGYSAAAIEAAITQPIGALIPVSNPRISFALKRKSANAWKVKTSLALDEEPLPPPIPPPPPPYIHPPAPPEPPPPPTGEKPMPPAPAPVSWFEQETDIAGYQVKNWMLLAGALGLYLLTQQQRSK